jgi:pantothenate kinase-related protein Tda10
MFVSFSGSGKSYLAKMLRDLEVENGGDAPRIHSMDDYFMTEVEKVVEYSYWIYYIYDKALLCCHI